jgi:hypothetical protein
MLEGLDKINWRKLHHAYGNARDVPGLIRALLSPDAEVREKAFYELYGNIFHQGTRYEATPYAVPFFFELLTSPETPDRADIVYYLVALALGYEEELLPAGVAFEELFGTETEDADLPVPPTLEEETVAAAESDADEEGEDEEDDDDYYEDEDQWLLDFRNSYVAVERGVPDFIRLAGEDAIPVQRAAIYALAWFPRKAEASLPVVREAVTQAQDEVSRANALLSFGLLARAQGDRASATWLEEALANAQSEESRTAAAIALATLCEAELPEAALLQLIESVQTAGEEAEAEEEKNAEGLGWNDGDLIGYASAVLAAVSEGNEEKIVAALCTALHTAAPMRSLVIAQALLATVFPEDPMATKSDFKALTPLQQTALRAIGQYGAWKFGSHDFSNYSGLVASYGLPSSQKDFLQFLEESASEPNG